MGQGGMAILPGGSEDFLDQLTAKAGGAPNCLVAKHEVGGTAHFFWSTEFDPPRPIGGLSEITDAHIRAIRPPRDESGWLDRAGWMGVYASRLIATQLQVV